ncbi:MAG: ABC transporter ATP-binding protein [Candidatus Omnitrophica bacterium]|nr:ABC transporter ATP-binding protein [Candidatus Omnitrophota bacterium]
MSKLLEVKNLKKYFSHHHCLVKALDEVSLEIPHGKTTALVGESGCGKTTLAKTILGFYRAQDGSVFLEGKNITACRRRFLARNIQIVFQNPYVSVDPRYTVYATLYEALTVFKKVSSQEAKPELVNLLAQVDLSPEVFHRYPHQLSGGQLQRVCIARSLINRPKLIILDEPTSALDITTTLKILTLLKRLQKELGVSYLFISHNLKLVRFMSDYVWVMYYGKIVEWGSQKELFENPRHPYTRVLLDAAYQRLTETASETLETDGCRFRARCTSRDKRCQAEPDWQEISSEHFVRCHRSGDTYV